MEPDFGQTEVKDGIWIDESYVVKDGDDAYVWTLNKKDKLEKTDRKSTRLNSSHIQKSRMPSSA